MIYRFGDFELDPDSYRLSRGGEAVSVEPRVFELLAYLVEHHQRLVPKQELLSEVWGGRVVTEAVLARAVHAARAALGPGPGAADWIRTVHGRGYRFAGEVQRLTAPAAPPPRPGRLRRGRPIAAVGALLAILALAIWLGRGREALAIDQGIALLPFVNATGDDANEWVELGLMDLVATRLARDHGLLVMPTAQTLAAVDALRIDPADGIESEELGRLRRALGSPLVLSALVAGEAGLFRLQMTVHGGPAGTHSRSRTGSDLLAVAAELSEELSGRMGGGTTNGPRAADDALAAGIHELLSGRPAEARLIFESVLDVDAGNVEARYRLASALRDLAMWDEAGAEAEAAREASAAAADVASEARAELLLGDIDQLRGGYDGAEGHYRRALDLFTTAADDRGRASAWSSLTTVALQRHDWDEAQRRSARALAICRELRYAACMLEIEHTLGVRAGRGGALADADRHFENALELARDIGDRRSEARALANLGSNAQNRGDWDRAEELHRQALRLRREQRDTAGTASSLVNLAVTGTWRGALAGAQADAAEALGMFARLGNRRGEAMAHTVLAYVAKDRADWPAARASMERARTIWSDLGVVPRAALALATLAEIADESGDPATARRLAAEAHAAILETGDRNLLAYALRARARAEAAAGEPEDAQRLFREALELAREVGNEGIEGSIATDLAELLLDEERPDEAAPLVSMLRARLPQSGPVTLLAARLALARKDEAAGCELLARARGLSRELWDPSAEARLAPCEADGVTDG